MYFLIFIFLSLFLFSAFFWTLRKSVFLGKWEYIIFFLLLYFPVYTLYLSVSYASTESILLVKTLQFLKDGLVILAVILFILFNKNIYAYPFRLNIVDMLFIAFLTLATFFLLAPIGEAGFLSKLLYFKGMLIPAMIYFMGRNTAFSEKELHVFFKIIFAVTIGALIVNLFEAAFEIHLQSYTGYALYNLAVNDIEPTGNFGLTWTFETQAVTKRLASFFSDPLELASSVLLGFSSGLIWFLTTKRKDWPIYSFVMLCAMGSLFFAASRASFLAFFAMIFFIALVFKLYRLILSGVGLFLLFVIYVVFFASQDFYYFVVDTITFENTSSLGHLVEWLLALDSMIANPLGIGLAMSGNVGSVEDELRVGGENQFLIFGVQLGWIGMLIYILIIFYSIKTSLKVFQQTENVMTARIAFVAAAVKFGLLLPLFTANAEVYLYISWISWWMVGYSVNAYQKLSYPKPILA